MRRTLLGLALVLAVVVTASATAHVQEKRKKWKVPKRALRMKNKVKADAASIKIGKKLYMKECASCHGTNGKGRGPASKGLEVQPADHTDPTMRNEPDGSLYWKIRAGRNPMPAFREKFKKKQLWHLVNYIRTLHKKPVKSSKKGKDPAKPGSKGGD